MFWEKFREHPINFLVSQLRKLRPSKPLGVGTGVPESPSLPVKSQD